MLRVCVVAQCLGNAWAFGVVGESPVFSVLWHAHDLGGLGMSEAAAGGVQSAMAIAWLVAGLATAVRPRQALVAWVAGLQVVVASALAYNHSGFHQSLVGGGGAFWLDGAIALVSQAARVAAPLGLIFLMQKRDAAALGVMKWGIVLTFVAHGWKAIEHYPKFVDMILIAHQRLLGGGIAQQQVETLLTAIGLLDLIAALLVLFGRFRLAIGYMAFWGLVTAAARLVVANSWTEWHQMATRTPHFLVPAVIVVCWTAMRYDVDVDIERSTED